MTLGRFKSKDDTRGVRVCIDEDSQCYLRIRRISNKDYQSALNKALKRAIGSVGGPNGSKYAGRSKDASSELFAKAIDAISLQDRKRMAAKHLLVGWDNLTDDFGDFPEHCEDGSNRMIYSPEAAMALLTHERYTDFYDLIVEIANDDAQFREDRLEDEAGNSSKPSAGISTTPKKSGTKT